MKTDDLKIGDKIEINPFHYRLGRKRCVRVIRDINSLGVCVNVFGWVGFILKDSEIIRKVD